MDSKAEEWAWKQRVGSIARKMTLLMLARQADDQGVARVTHDALASQCETSRVTVGRHLEELERDGFITVERTNTRDAARYQLNLSVQGAPCPICGSAPK